MLWVRAVKSLQGRCHCHSEQQWEVWFQPLPTALLCFAPPSILLGS